MNEALAFLEGLAADVTPGERARLAAEAEDRRQDAEDERKRAEGAERRAERAEALALADRQAGGALAEMSRAQHALSAAADEVAEARARLEKAERKEASARGNVQYWAERSQQANEVVSRSQWRDPFAEAQRVASEAHREYVAASRAAMRAAAAGGPQPSRRPFGAGLAVRDLPEPTCADCLKFGASAEESWLIHNDPAPAEPPAVPSAGELAMFADADRARKFSDLIAKGYSREAARLACTPVGRPR